MTTSDLLYYIFFIVAAVAIHAGLWRIFEKAGEKGWKALVPFLNFWVLIQIVGKPRWWFVWVFIPVANLVVPFLLLVDICKSFGRDSLGAQTLAMLFPFVYLPYLGFHPREKYVGPGAQLAKGVKKGMVREWADAIVFALIAAAFIRTFFIEAYKIPTPSMERTMLVGDHLFVSKFHFGARIPITPLAFPLAHHTMPILNTKAYLDFIQLPYFRFPGLEEVSRNDIVVFNFPEGDTVVIGQEASSYYDLLRLRDGMRFSPDQLTVRPLDKKENYVKRCIAVGGDTLEIRDAQVYINGRKAKEVPKKQLTYRIVSENILGSRFFEQFDMRIAANQQINGKQLPGGHGFEYLLTTYDEMAQQMEQVNFIKSVKPVTGFDIPGQKKGILFPGDSDHLDWNLDNYGPIWIPEQGATVQLTLDNLPFYRRIIEVYENHDLQVNGSTILIDGQAASTYTFAQNYYWMMGDNRHQSQDSRFWGFVPEDHIVGKPLFIFFSRDIESPDKGYFASIRWDRILQIIH